MIIGRLNTQINFRNLYFFLFNPLFWVLVLHILFGPLLLLWDDVWYVADAWEIYLSFPSFVQWIMDFEPKPTIHSYLISVLLPFFSDELIIRVYKLFLLLLSSWSILKISEMSFSNKYVKFIFILYIFSNPHFFLLWEAYPAELSAVAAILFFLAQLTLIYSQKKSSLNGLYISFIFCLLTRPIITSTITLPSLLFLFIYSKEHRKSLLLFTSSLVIPSIISYVGTIYFLKWQPHVIGASLVPALLIYKRYSSKKLFLLSGVSALYVSVFSKGFSNWFKVGTFIESPESVNISFSILLERASQFIKGFPEEYFLTYDIIIIFIAVAVLSLIKKNKLFVQFIVPGLLLFIVARLSPSQDLRYYILHYFWLILGSVYLIGNRYRTISVALFLCGISYNLLNLVNGKLEPTFMQSLAYMTRMVPHPCVPSRVLYFQTFNDDSHKIGEFLAEKIKKKSMNLLIIQPKESESALSNFAETQLIKLSLLRNGNNTSRIFTTDLLAGDPSFFEEPADTRILLFGAQRPENMDYINQSIQELNKEHPNYTIEFLKKMTLNHPIDGMAHYHFYSVEIKSDKSASTQY